MQTSTWTEEEEDFVRRSAASGMSSTETAVQLSEIFIPRSRSAVIGFASRKGITFNSNHPHNSKPSRPPREKSARPKRVAGNIRPKAVARQSPEVMALRAQAAARLAAEEARVETEALADNPGVLFLERGLRQCAMPMPGWDNVPVAEKRVCGRPVTFRCDSEGDWVATSWCPACLKRVHQPTAHKLDPRRYTRLDRSVRRAA